MEQVNNKFDLHYYIGIIKRRKWHFLIPTIVVFLLFLVTSFILPKTYEAKAIILVEEKKVLNPLLKNLAVSPTIASRLQVLQEEILAWPRLYQLVDRLGLNKDIGNDPLALEKLINDIRRNISLKMRSNSVVVISYQGKDPANTQKLVNTLCDILIERNLAAQSQDTESAIGFITKQLEIYKKKLEQSEDALRKFKEVYGMGTLTKAQFSLPTESVSDSSSPSSTPVIATTVEQTSPAGVTISQINQELARLEADLVMASVECTPEHPRIKSIKERMQQLKEKRQEYIKKVSQQTGVKPDNYLEIADSFPRQQQELMRLTRDRAINEKIYAMLLERLETAKITESLDQSENKTNFRIIEPARYPLIPVKPNKIKFNLIGLIFGGMLGFGFVYLLEYTDTSFRREEDLKERFGYPVLGVIPKINTEEEMIKYRQRIAKISFWIGLSVTIILLIIVFVIYHQVVFLNLKQLIINFPDYLISLKENLAKFWDRAINFMSRYFGLAIRG